MIVWAFIYLSPGCNPKIHKATIASPGWEVCICGVDSIDDGCELAKTLVSSGCQLIEVCGGFGKDGAERLVAAIDDAVPVGYVDYFPDGPARLQEILSHGD
ncbi:MAG: DUF6506 family protein [Christensenellaceae bacterium]|jgi:hypothetical protein|nr:DUF6506 family protein [Christensenellaceae bacterium]